MAIWFFLSTVVVVVTALRGCLVKGFTKNAECLGLRVESFFFFGRWIPRRWSMERKGPSGILRETIGVLEWQFAIEEALALVPPADQVRFAVPYLSGDARRWFMTAISRWRTSE